MSFSKNGAWLLARGAHAGQMYGDQPYYCHLQDVVRIVMDPPGIVSLGNDEIVQVAYLHDILEDTKITVRDLEDLEVGPDVIKAVQFVTDEPGENRKLRKIATYERVKLQKQEPLPHICLGLIVKWADRVANVRNAAKSNPGLLRMYAKEAEAFRDAYQPILGMHDARLIRDLKAEHDRILGLRQRP